MPDHEDLAAAFEASRDRLRAIAYRMLGSLSDADDAELAGLPVIANVDFGHTTPIITFPVGGTVEVRAEHSAPRLTITSH